MKLTQVKSLLSRLHDDENGDIPVGPILVIGLVVIPLVIAITVFGERLVDWFEGKWGAVEGKQNAIEFN